MGAGASAAAAAAAAAAMAEYTSAAAAASAAESAPAAAKQGLTLVHVEAQLEHIRDTFVGQVRLSGAHRQLKLS